MSAHDAHVNTPAAAWAWLTRELAGLDAAAGRSMNGEWHRFRSDQDGHGNATSLTDWPADFWIARGQKVVYSQLVPVWAIPERLDQWPAVEIAPDARSLVGKLTKGAPFLDLLAGTDPTRVLSEDDPIPRFYELDESSAEHADDAMVSADQIRAWLSTAFGDLLTGIALTPVGDGQFRDRVVQEVVKRIANLDSLPEEVRRLDFLDYGCTTLYSTQITQAGMRTAFLRQGQGEEWQHHWAWLSTPQDADAMQATLDLAGRLLINDPLLMGLTSTIRSGNELSRKRALCVMRRWLLTTKVLAWVVEALRHNWRRVRPQDLACFAFSALSPAWPRRAVAVSHRSAEAKPVLTTLKLWNSPYAAVDACYVPAWETNTGMIWSLFAAVPVIVRVQSPAYFESEWCEREHEMVQYLADGADFLEQRTIVDIGVDQLAELDASLFDAGAERDSSSRARPFPAPEREFPPLSLVLIGNVPVQIDLALLRAAGALRLINALVRNPKVTNQLASRAVAGDEIDIEPPANNPEKWAAYGDVLRDLEALLEEEQPKRSVFNKLRRRKRNLSLSLRLPDDYSALDVQLDRASAGQIPDLSRGQYRLADVLAALEWRRTVLTWFQDEGFGDKVMVDVSGTNAEEWTSLPDTSLARGLLALNASSPTWIMQHADQNAHLWPGFREQPIFTRHVNKQFHWLKPVFLNPSWLLYYLANSGLSVERKLQAAMIAAVVHAAGPEAVKVERQADGMGVVVPEPRSLFMVPTDAFHDVLSGSSAPPNSGRDPNPGL